MTDPITAFSFAGKVYTSVGSDAAAGRAYPARGPEIGQEIHVGQTLKIHHVFINNSEHFTKVRQ